MRNPIKRIALVIAVFALTMSMSAAAYAVVNPSSGSTITFEKNLKVKNPTLTSVDGPGATFTYSIAPETPSQSNGGTTITDKETPPNTGTVHIGPADGVTFSTQTISYPIGTAVNASQTGADNKKTITATADLTRFTAPGIYRYKITESSTLGDCEASNTDGVRYLDVYIMNGTSGLQVSGIVMHDGTVDGGSPKAANKKTFDDASFETVNVKLSKSVLGNMGDKNHQFPFAAAVSDHGRFYYAKKNTAPTASDTTSTLASQSFTLKDTEEYFISGLSKNATVGYTETNNTQDTYKVNYTGGEETDVAAGSTKVMTAADVDNISAVTFTNKFDSVSPTGVVMRFGPYIAMIIVAALLVVTNRRTRKNKGSR